MKYIIYYEGEDIPTAIPEPLEVSDLSEGLPSGETDGETEIQEDSDPENLEDEVQNNSENTTYEVIDYNNQLQTILENVENMRDLVHAGVIMIAILTLFVVIYEFFRGVSR